MSKKTAKPPSELQRTIEVMTIYNAWHRGDNVLAIPPKEIGESIDHAIRVLTIVDEIMSAPKNAKVDVLELMCRRLDKEASHALPENSYRDPSKTTKF